MNPAKKIERREEEVMTQDQDDVGGVIKQKEKKREKGRVNVKEIRQVERSTVSNKHMAKRISITPGIKTKIDIEDKDTEGLGQKSQEAAPLRSGIGGGF